MVGHDNTKRQFWRNEARIAQIEMKWPNTGIAKIEDPIESVEAMIKGHISAMGIELAKHHYVFARKSFVVFGSALSILVESLRQLPCRPVENVFNTRPSTHLDGTVCGGSRSRDLVQRYVKMDKLIRERMALPLIEPVIMLGRKGRARNLFVT